MVIEIEVRNPANRGLLFKPLMTPVRGAIDFAATRCPDLWAVGMEFGGKPIPGQRIMLDTEKGTGIVYDPLALPENEAVAEKLRAKLSGPVKGAGIKFAEPKKHDAVHPATWLYHMRRAVEGGLAVVTQGDVNAKVDGVPQKEFIHRREPDKQTGTIAALLEQNALLTKLLLESLPADKRAALATQLGK